MACFSGSTRGQSVQQVEKLTPEQQQLVALLTQQAGPAIRAVGGATIPGQQFAPSGPSGLQQQTFGAAGGQGLDAFLQSIQPFGGQQFAQQVGGPLSAFAQNQFQQETIPAIAGAVGAGGGARSSGFQDILAREGRNLQLGLNAQLAPLAFGAQQSALGRQFQGAQGLAGFAGLGAQQRRIGEEQRQFGLQQFMAGAPEADPRLGFIGPAFTSSFDTAVQQGFFEPGIGSQLAGPLASLGGSALIAGALSDERIKENIEPIDDALEKVKQLKGMTYNYKFNEPDNRNGGIMAQELEKVLPDAVSEINGIKYVRYDAVIALLVNAMNELARKVA